MVYIIADFAVLTKYQRDVNAAAGFPEPLNIIVQFGTGRHAPKELGRAMDFAPIEANANGDRFALPAHPAKAAPEGCEVVEKLPEDWKPVEAFIESQVVSKKV